MTKLLWHSNSPWAPTGYGQQTALMVPRLKPHFEMAVSSFFGLDGAPITWEGVPVFPGIAGTFGDEPMVRHAKQWFGGDPKNGYVMTLMDVWVLNPGLAQQVNMICWTPVDHEPAPPKVVKFLAEADAVPIAMSRFGERMLGRMDPLYCPHGIDTDTYRPYDKRAVYKEVGLTRDCFLVGMVAANKGRDPSRKGFSQAFQAFKHLSDRHDNAYLYLHTTMNPAWGAGEDLAAMLEALDIPQERVLIADQYRMCYDPFSQESMAKIYSAMDVLLAPSFGEGFGIPIIEAQSCGTPVIVTDATAMTELCGGGWKVSHTPWWTGMNAWQFQPHVPDIADALEDCYGLTHSQRETISGQARRHALNYNVDRVVEEHMLPSIRKAVQRFESQRPVTIAPRLRAAA